MGNYKNNDGILTIRWLLCLLLAGGVSGCESMTREVMLDLPEFPPQLVVECYLEADSICRVSVTETVPFLSLPDSIKLVNDAIVTLTAAGRTDTLKYYPPFSRGNSYFFGEYRLNRVIPADYDIEYELCVSDNSGQRKACGKTRLLPPIPIDSVEFINERTDLSGLWALIIRWYDPNPGKENYYRVVFDNNKPDSLVNYMRTDLNLTSGRDATGSGFNYLSGDSVLIRFYNCHADYFAFYRSYRIAEAANSNPFAEPVSIRSTLKGNGVIGVFTGMGQTRKKVRVP